VLATVCLAVFAIDLDTTIVNVALPSLSRQLGAGTSTLQWVVDGYSLAFAALVLTGGSLGDRFGRRPVLVTGLLGFAAASALGGVVHQAGALVVLRFAMGAFDALICPTTLSVIISAYRDRAGRARAIGVWGAVTGLSVAVGPVTGGLLLAHFWYGSVFWALVPVALIAAIATMLIVPESRQPGAARIDLPGLLVSSAAIGLLVYTIIEAPDRGWGAASSIAGFAGTALLGTAFAVVERHTAEPMLDLTLFKVPAFSAASGSLTIAFFALFGFIFLVTQYFQFIRGYGPLSTGVRILPVALSIAAGSARRIKPGRPDRHPRHRHLRPDHVRPGVRVDRRLAGSRALPADRRPDGDHGHRTRADQHSGHRVHPVRTTPCQGRNRLSGQRRHPRGRRCPGRCRHWQRLQQHVPAQAGYHTHGRASRVRLRRGTQFGSRGTGHRAPHPGLTLLDPGCDQLLHGGPARRLRGDRTGLLGRRRRRFAPPRPPVGRAAESLR
jgi:MFS family permease